MTANVFGLTSHSPLPLQSSSFEQVVTVGAEVMNSVGSSLGCGVGGAVGCGVGDAVGCGVSCGPLGVGSDGLVGDCAGLLNGGGVALEDDDGLGGGLLGRLGVGLAGVGFGLSKPENARYPDSE